MSNSQADKDAKEFYKTRANEALLYEACRKNKPRRTLLSLLRKGVNPNCFLEKIGVSPLIYAIMHHYPDIVKILVKHGANIEYRDPYDKATALTWASHYGDIKSAETLIKAGCDIESKDKSGYTALMNSVVRGKIEMMQYLIQSGANVHTRDKCQRTLLAWAAAKGHTQIVKFLIQGHADINAHDKDGETPVMAAAQFLHGRALTYLAAHGANLDEQNKNANTPRDIAKQYPKLQEALVKGELELRRLRGKVEHVLDALWLFPPVINNIITQYVV